MNTNGIYQPYQKESTVVWTSSYDARKELVTRLVKEDKITLDEAFILLGLSSPITSSNISSVWDPSISTGTARLSGVTTTNQTIPTPLKVSGGFNSNNNTSN